MNIKSLTTLIFDLDDTLCRYTSDIEAALLDTFELEEADNLPLTPEDYKQGFDVEFDKAINGEVAQPDMEFRTRVFWNKLKDKNYEEHEILEFGRKFAGIREHSLALYPGAKKLFKKLTGKFKLGLLTNGPSNLQRRKIKVLEIEDWFDAIIVSGEHNLAKPDPRIFYIAMDKLGCKPTKSVYIGNSLQYDVLGANNAGIPVIWKRNGDNNIEVDGAKPNLVIEDLKELFQAERKSTLPEEEKRSIKS